MKITIVQGAFLPVPPHLGGAVEKIWFRLGRRFSARGHQVCHISRRYEGLPDDEVVDGVRYLRVRGHDTPASRVYLKWLDLRYTQRVLRLLPEADILVTHTFWLPLFYNPRRDWGKCYVHVARFPKGQIRFYRNAHRLQTVSTNVAAAIRTEAPRLADRVTVIPYPAPSPAQPLPRPPRPRKPEDPARLLYVGRLHPEKGVDLLLQAIAALPGEVRERLECRIIGPWETAHGGGGEPYRRRLNRLARSPGSRVHILDPVFDPERLNQAYAASDLFIYPSLAERGETFGLAVLEAMANGLPVLVSNLACFRDFVSEGENGWAFDHRADSPASVLCRKLQSILKQPDALARASKNALETAARLSEDDIADRFIADFEHLLRPE